MYISCDYFYYNCTCSLFSHYFKASKRETERWLGGCMIEISFGKIVCVHNNSGHNESDTVYDVRDF